MFSTASRFAQLDFGSDAALGYSLNIGFTLLTHNSRYRLNLGVILSGATTD